MSNFSPASVKLTIVSKDISSIKVSAQYNPKELQIDQTVPWQKPAPATNAPAGGSGGSGGSSGGSSGGKGKDKDPMTLEFTGAEGRTMSLEFMFDGYESGARGLDVKAQVALLQQLASVIDPKSSDENKRRPHHCVVTWGGTLPPFECVIESLSTKYTMFSTDGMPLRATCTVKLKEAKAVSGKV